MSEEEKKQEKDQSDKRFKDPYKRLMTKEELARMEQKERDFTAGWYSNNPPFNKP